MRYAFGAFLTAALLASAAYAQTQNPAGAVQPNFDQFPSFIEMSVNLQDGTQTTLRCGYSQAGTTITADPGYMEMSVLNAGTGSYIRYQRIDNNMVITTPAQNAPGRFLVELVPLGGAPVAKNCQVNGTNDTISNCTTTQPFMMPTQIASQDANAANQCGAFFAKAIPQIDRFTFNAQKTEAFKAGLRQKISILKAP